jgi:hypothetical protein
MYMSTDGLKARITALQHESATCTQQLQVRSKTPASFFSQCIDWIDIQQE